VVLEARPPPHGPGAYPRWTSTKSARCDLCLVVGGDGTMLGIGRQLAAMARR
jgi:NAD kinase